MGSLPEPFWAEDGLALHVGDCREVMAALEPESASCVVTSPPFWGLRSYKCEPTIWGGDPDCPHALGAGPVDGETYAGRKRDDGVSRQETPEAWVKGKPVSTGRHDQDRDTRHTDGRNPATQNLVGCPSQIVEGGATCSLCGAWRGQLGLEPTVAAYIEHTMEWMREVKRVLRKDGVFWLDIDDSRGSAGGQRSYGSHDGQTGRGPTGGARPAFKPKSLCLIPQRIALAAQEDGWIVRSQIVISTWMPESAKDRPTDAYRTVLMLVKSPHYWYDAQAVRVAGSGWHGGIESARYEVLRGKLDTYDAPSDGQRNLGNLWLDLPPSSSALPGEHFATFPLAQPERCIRASCPAVVCAKCGKARVRIAKVKERVLKREPAHAPNSGPTKVDSSGWEPPCPETLGWTDCGHDAYEPGLVLDPFAGTCTTLIAARMLGRRAIGIELSEHYAAQAVKRLTLGDKAMRRLADARRAGAEQGVMFGG